MSGEQNTPLELVERLRRWAAMWPPGIHSEARETLKEAIDEIVSLRLTRSETATTVWGPEKQDYPGGPIYRVGTSTGATLSEQPRSATASISPELLARLDEMYEKVPHGVWHIFQTKWPYHFEIGPSERQMCAILTNDGTPENEFGEANARMLSEVMTYWPEIRRALGAVDRREKT